jgi:hypothetical protein
MFDPNGLGKAIKCGIALAAVMVALAIGGIVALILWCC